MIKTIYFTRAHKGNYNPYSKRREETQHTEQEQTSVVCEDGNAVTSELHDDAGLTASKVTSHITVAFQGNDRGSLHTRVDRHGNL